MLFIIEKRLQRKVFNKESPNMKPCENPKKISSHELYSMLILVLSQQTFLVFQDVFSVTSFVFQDLLKTPSRRPQDVFAIRLPKTSSRRFQDIFKTSSKTSSRRLQVVFKTCLQDVLQLCLQDVLEDKKMLHWRRLEDALKTSSVRLHQDECLLGCFLFER